jgi:hypothetical protein
VATLPGNGWVGIGAVTTGALIPVRSQSHGLWELTAPPAPETAALLGSIKVDTAIIGGGYGMGTGRSKTFNRKAWREKPGQVTIPGPEFPHRTKKFYEMLVQR